MQTIQTNKETKVKIHDKCFAKPSFAYWVETFYGYKMLIYNGLLLTSLLLLVKTKYLIEMMFGFKITWLYVLFILAIIASSSFCMFIPEVYVSVYNDYSSSVMQPNDTAELDCSASSIPCDQRFN
ncbi:hypothetical protein ACI65C_008952 [Semiaphis heraclei]